AAGGCCFGLRGRARRPELGRVARHLLVWNRSLHTGAAMTTETSPRRFAHYGAIMLAALGMIPGGGHVLEMPPRMRVEPELYMEVTSTMYSLYGAVGAMIQLFAVAVGVLLIVLVRGTPAFRVALAGLLCLLASI